MNSITSNLELRSGQQVGCIMYDGNSKIVATMMYGHFKAAQEGNKPIPLGNTNLLMHVTEVEMKVDDRDILTKEPNYIVRLKGVLE